MNILKAFKYKFFFIVFSTALILFSSCKSSTPPKPPPEKILIYCGITMVKPMLEIADIIESTENVDITITKGGSGNLMKSFLYSKTGDLYLPGSDKYYQILEKEHPGVIIETSLVGYNKAAIMVQKGNPKKITNDLKNFTKKQYAIVIGNPNSGSIGKETERIFNKKGIYNEVLKNTMRLTTDSKDLVKALCEKEADLVVNWYAVSTWDNNKKCMDVIEIEPSIAKNKKLILGLLKYSKNKEVARKIMEYASSEKGKAVFKKYGLFF